MSEPEIVHPVPVDASGEWARTIALALLDDPFGPGYERRMARVRRLADVQSRWGVRDRGSWVGALATMRLPLSLPGGIDATVSGLTAVSVAATHRRRGLLRRMITESLDEAVAQSELLSILVAAEWPIYGRYGYAPAVYGAEYRLHPRLSGGVTGADPTTVRSATADEVAAVAPALFETARLQQPGGVGRRPDQWHAIFGVEGAAVADDQRHSWFVHDGPDGVDGFLGRRTTRGFELVGPLGAVSVTDLTAVTDEAYRDLWGYLCGIDVVDDVDFHGAVDEPARLLLGNGRALEQRNTYDFVWVRLLDVPGALAARRYATAGSVVFEVVDDLGGWAAGRYRLDVDEAGSAVCAPTSAAPDVRVDQRALASCYLGGHRLGAVPRVEELRTGTLARADVMFSTPRPPFNRTGF